MDDPAAGADALRVQRLDVGPAVGCQRDDIQMICRRLSQPHDMVFIASRGLAPCQAVLGGDFLQSPGFEIEAPLGLEVGNTITYIADFSHPTMWGPS